LKSPSWKNAVGIVLVLLFSILTAAKEVYAAHIIQTVDPFPLLFFCFVLTVAVANVHYLLRGCPSATMQTGGLPSIIALNFAAAFSWMGFFYSMKHIEPVVSAGIITALGPMLTIVFNWAIRKESPTRPEVVASIGMAICILYMAFATTQGASGIAVQDKRDVILGLASAFGAGVSFAITTVCSKQLSDRGWVAARILAYRYFALLLITGLLTFSQEGARVVVVAHPGAVALIAILGITVPLYCLQFGIQFSKPQAVSLTVAVGPAFTLLFEKLDTRIEWSWGTFAFVFALVALSIYGVIADQVQSKNAPEPVNEPTPPSATKTDLTIRTGGVTR
jgi:drug/metabolite transporter (DMT)-like permease